MNVQGKIKLIGETQTFGANGFQKREVVVTTDEQYPQNILIEFVKDKCDLLDNYKADDQVQISINLRGREWINPEGEAKYFNSVQGWRIEKLESSGEIPEPPASQPIQEEKDPLPF
jgi:hypothetical protein